MVNEVLQNMKIIKKIIFMSHSMKIWENIIDKKWDIYYNKSWSKLKPIFCIRQIVEIYRKMKVFYGIYYRCKTEFQEICLSVYNNEKIITKGVCELWM